MEMIGHVTAYLGYGQYEVLCPDAPEHLRSLILTWRQLLGAAVGDRVRLKYQVTASSGLWNAVEILTP